jgi:hypothetical protein
LIFALLPLAVLILGRNPAVNGNPLSHLIPRAYRPKTPVFVELFIASHYITLRVVK